MAKEKKEFNLGESLAAALGNVSDPDQSEQIVYVDITLIDEDKNNFYSMDGIDELAASIELIGLQQPVRLRENPDMPGRYLLVSGHRRRRAFWSLYEENPEKWRRIAAIIEKPAASPELQELRLIMANADTRRMSSADLAKQVERVQMLLYKLKEDGVIQFSGRMRDAVAEACKVSSTRLANLKTIREKLIPELRALWEDGKLNESCAYRIAQESQELQQKFHQSNREKGIDVTQAPEWSISRWFLDAKRRAEFNMQPPQTEPAYDPEEYKQQLDKEREMLRCAIRESFLEGFCGTISRAKLPENRLEAIDRIKKVYRRSGCWGAGYWCYDGQPNGLQLRTPDGTKKFLAHYTDIFDQLALVAIDELFARFEEDRKNKKAKSSADQTPPPQRAAGEPEWQTGEPPQDGRYICLVDMGLGRPHEQRCDRENGVWKAYGNPVSEMFTVRAWWPLPRKAYWFPNDAATEEWDEEDEEE